MILRNDFSSKNRVEELIINSDIHKDVIGQVDSSTILKADIFKNKDKNKFASIKIGVDTDFFLDMLLDANGNNNKDISYYFTQLIKDNYDSIVYNSDNGDFLFFNDGMLCALDEEFNEKIIKETYND